MENWRENISMISRLKVTGKPADALGQRLFFERLFGAANFHPPGISPRAVICIRKLNAPPFENNRQKFDRLALDWEIGIRGAVEKLTRRAFRPVRETVPSEAESVIFEDKAEMLACLARDWLGGSLTARWWWRALFPNLFRTGTIIKIWLEAAEFTPSALDILSKNGAAEDFVGKLEPPEAFSILNEIARIFGLGKLSAALVEPPGKSARATSEPVIEPPPKSRFREHEILAARAESDAFFASLIPETKTSDLSFERRVLLETAFLLARSPRLARSAEFAERVILIRATDEFGKTVTGKKIVVPGEKTGRREGGQEIRKSRKPRLPDKDETLKGEPPVERNKQAVSDRRGSEKGEKLSEETPSVSGEIGESSRESSFETEPIKAPPRAKIRFEAFRSEADTEPPAQKTKTRDPFFDKRATTGQIYENFFEASGTEPELSFQTRFGGVFYLLNLGLYLGLYRDFTESLTDEIDLNIWDFVAIIGLELLGEELETDAVWDFLKRAATREKSGDFGREFDRARDWRVPTAWLATFSADRTWIWTSTKKRLVVRHPSGFNVIDIRRRGRAPAQLAGELEIYRKNFARIVRADGKDEPPESKSWLKNLAEYLQKRLFQALNLNTADKLNELLFARRATVTVSTTHLEVTFALADLPIEVRLAGIDRDPAWIPAAGKYVYFHFF